MDNYIKTIINGLKTWVTSEIESLKNTILRMFEAQSADTDAQCKSIKDEVAQTTAKVESLSNIQVVKCDILDTGGPASSYVENWETLDWGAPCIIFFDPKSYAVIVGSKVFLGPGEDTYYQGISSLGRRVRFDLVGGDTVYCNADGANSPRRTLVGEQVVDNLDQKPGTDQPYVLSANQGYELKKQITELTARLEALEQGATT